MAVELRTSPTELAELDGDLFDALEVELGERWPLEVELAASNLETTHEVARILLAAHRDPKKLRTLPEPLEVPRPEHVRKARAQGPAGGVKTTVVSPSEFASMYAGARVRFVGDELATSQGEAG